MLTTYRRDIDLLFVGGLLEQTVENANLIILKSEVVTRPNTLVNSSLVDLTFVDSILLSSFSPEVLPFSYDTKRRKLFLQHYY